jgi:hypothetical protein
MRDRFLKECKVTAKAGTYLIFCLVLAAIFFFLYRPDVRYDLIQSQKGILFEETKWGATENHLLVKPAPDMENYGSEDAEVPDQVRRNMAYRLYRDMVNNRYDTYRFGILTHKNLKYDDRQKVLAIFEKITGESFYKIDAEFYIMDLEKVMEDHNLNENQAADYLREVYYKQLRNEFTAGQTTTMFYDYAEYIPVNDSLSYDEYKKEIAELRKIIGGHSDDYTNFAKYGSVPVTYDESLARYETVVYKDGISGAYARLFCDYMGAAAGLLPALIAWEIFRGGFRGKKRDDDEIWIRFFAITAMSLLPVLILAVAATFELSSGVRPLGLSVDYFAYVGYSLLWLLPTTAFAAAVGLLFTVVTKRSVGIYVQLVIWYWSMSLWTRDGLEPVKYGANMFLRHSILGGYDLYAASLGWILVNRMAYLLAAIVLTAAAWYAKDRQLQLPAMPRIIRRRAV